MSIAMSDYKNKGYVEKPKIINIRNSNKFFGNSNKGYKLTDKGEYSVAKPEEADKISQILILYFKNPEKKIITDATLGMAGNTINFTKYFKCVNAFELDNVHYDIAKNNIKVAGVKDKVKLIKGNYTELYKTVKQHMIYIDAPWGGRGYHRIKNLKLKLSGQNISTFCNNLKGKSKYVALNLPFNFDFNDLLKNTKFDKLHVYKITEKQYLGVLL